MARGWLNHPFITIKLTSRTSEQRGMKGEHNLWRQLLDQMKVNEQKLLLRQDKSCLNKKYSAVVI